MTDRPSAGTDKLMRAEIDDALDAAWLALPVVSRPADQPSAATLTDIWLNPSLLEAYPDERLERICNEYEAEDAYVIDELPWLVSVIRALRAELRAARHAQQQAEALVAAAQAVTDNAIYPIVSRHGVDTELSMVPVCDVKALEAALAAAEQDAGGAGEP